MRLPTHLFFLFLFCNLAAQESDIVTPKPSPFQVGANIEGVVKNSVNEATGKVTFSVRLGSMSARTMSFPLNLAYNGASAFHIGQELNKYSPTSTVGVGFSIGVPQIVVDDRGTAAKDDDVFYLKDNSNNTKLVCTKKVEPSLPVGSKYQEFETEKFVPYKISYNQSTTDMANGAVVIVEQDFWTIINDSGVTYTYGATENSKENIIAWGNWIGSSKNITGASKHTKVWNLTKIEDQWGNRIDLTYDKVEQGINTSGPKYTEASYVSEIKSSTGGKIQLNYGNKNPNEYYDPHAEAPEPDAYQERYEKKFLESVDIFNRDNQVVNTYDFAYDFESLNLDTLKRYLKSITFKDNSGTSLPSHDFEYYSSGDFKGGLQKVTYPTGGSVTYNYENKLLYTNTANRYEEPLPSSSGYVFHSAYTRDNYVLRLYRSADYISGNKYRFKMVRHWWNGNSWDTSEFVLPPLLSDENIQGKVMDRFLSVFEEDFYGFLWFNRDTDEGDLYLFHQNKDGHTWDESHIADITIESYDDANKQEDPVLKSGNGFVTIGTNRSGRIYTYNWNGDSWNEDQIQHGHGQYYYGVANNFILVFNEDGGPNMVTGVTYPDNYYIHYLNAEKEWKTKSWSAYATSHLTPIEDYSVLYPDNSIAAFVAPDNPESFLRWDENYNLIAVDDILGSYPESYPVYPSLSSMFTIQNSWYNSFPERSARFNGNTWDPISLNPDNFNSYSTTAFGEDFILMYDRLKNNRNKASYFYYDPNNNSWISGFFNESYSPNAYWAAVAYNREFIVAGNKAIELNNNSSKFGSSITLPLYNNFCYSNTLNYSFVELSTGTTLDNSLFLFVDKTDGNIKSIDVGANRHTVGSSKFGGFYQFMSLRSMFLKGEVSNVFTPYLYRLVNDGVDNDINDVVVGQIEIDNGNNEIRKTNYTYTSPQPLPNDETTFYGEVVIENKGFGSGNNGKIKKYFNTGDDDVQMAGLPTNTIIADKNGIVKSKTETVWKKFTKNYMNSSYKIVDIGYYLRPEKQIETLILNGQEVISETNNTYNPLGMLSNASKTNSNGETEYTSIQYAYQNYGFVNDDNMLSFPYETKSVVAGKTVAVERSLWKQEDGKIYAYQNTSGVEPTTMRVNNETTMVDSHGNLQESNNGLGVYKTVLYGYGNLYPIATISNVKYTDAINALDVSYYNLQNLATSNLEPELRKLYSRLPEAMININLYDNMGRVIRTLDEREEVVNFGYDTFGRIEYTTDANDNVMEKKEYYFGS